MNRPTPTAPLPRWLILLGLVAALVPLSIDLYLPALPAIGAALHTERGAVERSIPAYLIGLTVGQLIYGPLSDRIGRRPTLLAGLGLYVLASLGCAVATHIDGLTAWRLVQGFGGGAGIVLTLAIIRDRLDPQAAARALSALMLVTGLAPILAPLLGGWLLAATSWQGIFYFQTGFAVLCATGLLGFMPETRNTVAGGGGAAAPTPGAGAGP
ncbi:MAG: MFS transporter, partial [Panacagrimonas sp.]